MYAHIDRPSSHGHAEDDPGLVGINSSSISQPGLLGAITFRQFAGPAGVCLTLWDTEADAAAFAGQYAELAALPGEIYQVVNAGAGPAATRAPAYAQLMYFDGPRAPEQAAAEDLAGRQRIWPAIRNLSGLVGVYVLRGRDLGSVVITLTTSAETLDAAARAVMSTELQPDEDPALLPGPDRIEIHHVTGYHLPAVRSGQHEGTLA
jgi:hypothetical protein